MAEEMSCAVGELRCDGSVGLCVPIEGRLFLLLIESFRLGIGSVGVIDTAANASAKDRGLFEPVPPERTGVSHIVAERCGSTNVSVAIGHQRKGQQGGCE